MTRASTHRYMTAQERLLTNRAIQPNGCWHYTGTINKDGYGRCGYQGKPGTNVHRVAYIEFIGPIPEGMTVNHRCHDDDPTCPGGKCDHRKCFNPQHLEAVPVRTNILNGKTPAAVNSARGACINGHEFTPANTYARSDGGGRGCRTCRSEAAKRHELIRVRPRPRKAVR